MSEHSPGSLDLYCKIITGFVSLSTYYMFHLIDITSRHFAVAFSIPIHNISIYFDKLFSVRCLLVLIGGTIEYVTYQIAGGDRDNSGYGKTVRKFFSTICFAILGIVRVILLVILYTSSQLSYYVYLILSAESLFYGLHVIGYMALVAGYMTISSFVFNILRIVISVFQSILDLFWYESPLLMIKIHVWICSIATGISLILWYYFNFVFTFKSSESSINTQGISRDSHELERKGSVNDGACAVVSPIMMYWSTTPISVYIFPGTLPYGLLERDKCHIINMLLGFFGGIGPFTFLLLDNIGNMFPHWSWHFDLFWILAIPTPIIFVYCFLAIHTRIPSAIAIINSRPRVMTMTFVLFYCVGFMESLCYLGVAKYASRGNPSGYTIQGIFNITSMVARTIISRLSVGYTVIRVNLGYHLPKFRPNHRMSKKNLGWYIFRQMFKRSWQDFKDDLMMDIKKYL